MSADCTIMRERQRDMFRVALAKGLTFKQLEHRCGHPERTLRSWARGEATAPLSALDGLLAGLPAEAAALLLPDGLVLVRVPEGADHDGLAAGMQTYLAQYVAARHPASEAGTELGAGEVAALDNGAAAVVAMGGPSTARPAASTAQDARKVAA